MLLGDVLPVELRLLLMSAPVIDGHGGLGLLQCLQHLDVFLVDLLNLLLSLTEIESTRCIWSIRVHSCILTGQLLAPSFELIHED